jgi:NAD(P)H-dependent FMN reductase
MAKQIGLIIGSTRNGRIGPKVADFIKSQLEAQADPSINISLVDIVAFNLPPFDEPLLPAMVPNTNGQFLQFTHEHSKAWSAEIAKYDGYIFLTPEWNFGIPGTAKNAIDFLYHACIGKPVLIVSYGIMGGKTASASLTTTLAGMHLQVVESKPSFEFPDRDAANHNSSPSLTSALGGELHEDSKKAWGADTVELLKGYGELKELLEAKKA